MALKSSPGRYGSMAIALHWSTAVLIVVLFATGLLATGQGDDAARVALLRFHVPLGVGVLLLTVLRIVWWWAMDRHPDGAADDAPWRRMAAQAVHVGFYAVILLLGASGVGTLLLSGALPAIAAGTALPDFSTIQPRLVHGLASKLMLALFVLHVAAALWHQFVRRDNLLARMGLGT